MIIFLDQTDGTEEIPSDQVQAIILKHDLPQLSHLAIRARQAKILFVCCENQEVYNQAKAENKHGLPKEVMIDGNGALIFSNCTLDQNLPSNTK